MSRKIFDHGKISARAKEQIDRFFPGTIDEIEKAVESNQVVVVGFAGNPYVASAISRLKKEKVAFQLLSYGTYFNNYNRRAAIKMWLGWHTFPMIFVNKVFIGGSADLSAELEDGTFQKRITTSQA